MFWNQDKPSSLVFKLSLFYCGSLLLLLALVGLYVYPPLNDLLQHTKTAPGSKTYLLASICIRKLFIVIFFASVISTVISYLISRRGIRYLHQFSNTLSTINSDSLHTQLESKAYPKELDKLTHTCNSMLLRINKDFDQQKQFSAMIAHELKNPLHYLQTATEISLSKPRPPQEYVELLQDNLEEYHHLSQLIDNLLLLARSEHNLEALTLKSSSILGAINSLTDYFQLAAEEKNLNIIIEVEGSAMIDQNLFKHAIANLIDNAIKFTANEGTIKISGYESPEGYKMTVSDNGIGIKEALIAKLFMPFKRQSENNSHGLGLGLAITNAIIKQHKGTIKVDSELGVGTKISINIPPPPADRNT